MKILTLCIASLLSTSVFAQTTVTVSTSAGNADQTYYSFANGEVSSPPLAEWDIAIEVVDITGSILANTAKGIKVYKAPYTIAQWANIDTAGLASSWPAQQNSEIDWSEGAFNLGRSGVFDLGWGVYNPVTHNIAGDSCFVLKLADGSWKKFRMDGFTATTNTFAFTWANLDGSGTTSGSLLRNGFPGKDFGYYSLVSNTVVDHEPVAATWDVLFTKYMAFVQQPFPAMYPVAGVLLNRQVAGLQVDGVPTTDADYWGQPFTENIDVIGFDWKNFNMGSSQWEYAQDRTYFVEARNGDIWKLVFTAYGGSANGNFTFTQERVGLASVNEQGTSSAMAIFPNPSKEGQVTLVSGTDVRIAQVTVRDLSGKVVYQEQLAGLVGLTQRTLDLGTLPAGLYMVQLQGEGVNTAVRLVLE